MKNIGSAVVKAFMWIFGLLMVFYGGNLLIASGREWSEAQAEVISSEEQYATDEGMVSYTISYRYQVDGVEYTDSMSSTRNYSPGEGFTIYFDPASPDVSYESQGSATLLGGGLCLFGLFCVGSMAWGVVQSRRIKKTQAPVQGPGPDNG